MLKDCLQIFKTLYKEKNDDLILNDYKLGYGNYILIGFDGDIIKNITVDEENSYDLSDYNYFKELDYLSNLISIQKPIDNKKIIHSNNYLSFFVQKQNLQNGKLTKEIIDNYYKILNNPKLKYEMPAKKNALLVYKDIEEKYGEPNIDVLNKNKEWVKKNIFNLLEKLKIENNKGYLKIFFAAPIGEYKRESQRYILPNIFNNVKYITEIEGSIYGASDNNITLNPKKPYLLNKTRKNQSPYLISLEEALLQKKFFDFLFNKINNGKNIVYLSEQKQFYLEEGEVLNEKFNGLFLKIEKGGSEPKIIDFSIIPLFNPKIKEIKINNKIISNKNDLLDIIDLIYFRNKLRRNLFKDLNDIQISDFKFKSLLLRYRDTFVNYFYKGEEVQLCSMWNKISKDIIKLSIINGYIRNAKQQEELRDTFFNY